MFKVQVTGIRENTWSGNGLTFETREDATTYAKDLMSRWTGCDMGRVVPVETPNGEVVDYNDEQIVLSYRNSK